MLWLASRPLRAFRRGIRFPAPCHFDFCRSDSQRCSAVSKLGILFRSLKQRCSFFPVRAWRHQPGEHPCTNIAPPSQCPPHNGRNPLPHPLLPNSLSPHATPNPPLSRQRSPRLPLGSKWVELGTVSLSVASGANGLLAPCPHGRRFSKSGSKIESCAEEGFSSEWGLCRRGGSAPSACRGGRALCAWLDEALRDGVLLRRMRCERCVPMTCVQTRTGCEIRNQHGSPAIKQRLLLLA